MSHWAKRLDLLARWCHQPLAVLPGNKGSSDQHRPTCTKTVRDGIEQFLCHLHRGTTIPPETKATCGFACDFPHGLSQGTRARSVKGGASRSAFHLALLSMPGAWPWLPCLSGPLAKLSRTGQQSTPTDQTCVEARQEGRCPTIPDCQKAPTGSAACRWAKSQA